MVDNRAKDDNIGMDYLDQKQNSQEDNLQIHDDKEGETLQEDSKENIEDKISAEIEEKIKALNDFSVGKNEEQILNIRMHQLALAKILIFTHGKNQFYLVEAHTQLGEAYLNFKCHEQAIDHLTIALKKNGKLFQELSGAKIYHTHILTLLGKCYLEIGSQDDALELLMKANEIQKSQFGDNESETGSATSVTQTLTLIANCYTKMKDFETAIEYMSKVWNLAEVKYGYKSENCAFAFLETAKVYSLKEDWSNAIDHQNRAIAMLMDLNFENREFLADMYISLGNFQEKAGNIKDLIECLHKVRNLYQNLYGPNDKKVIKIKRQISINLLKAEQHQQALQELLETEEMEVRFYGEFSVQVAKTQKIIGTIFILTQQYSDAQRYLNKALKIFEESGMKKAVNEIKSKLKLAKDMKEKGKSKKLDDDDD